MTVLRDTPLTREAYALRIPDAPLEVGGTTRIERVSAGDGAIVAERPDS
jgi:hypothetical protein